MKLSLNIPINHLSDFYDEVDFQVVDLDIFDTYPDVYKNIPPDMEVWLNHCTHTFLEKHLKTFLNGKRKLKICSLKSAAPALSYKKTLQCLYDLESFDDVKLVGVWDDEAYELNALEQLFSTIALPWWRPRRTYVARRDMDKTAYFGFSNLEELQAYTPAYLHTSVPIMAGYSGIDLRERSRRPKNIEFDPFVTLNERDIDLALTNIQAMKEAAFG